MTAALQIRAQIMRCRPAHLLTICLIARLLATAWCAEETDALIALPARPGQSSGETIAPLADQPVQSSGQVNFYTESAPPPSPVRGIGLMSIFRRSQPAPPPPQPSRNSGTIVRGAEFTTDYKARPAGTAVPIGLYGPGWDGRNLPFGEEDSYRLVMPADYSPTDLVLLPREFCFSGQPIYLRKEAAGQLVSMISDASRSGLRIQVVSGYRDLRHQQRLYYQAVARGGRGQGAVARPGHSEHQLGTTIDITSTENYLLKQSFGGTSEGRWAAANAARYGWRLSVVSSSGRVIEPWHLRYYGTGGSISGGAGRFVASTGGAIIKGAARAVTTAGKAVIKTVNPRTWTGN